MKDQEKFISGKELKTIINKKLHRQIIDEETYRVAKSDPIFFIKPNRLDILIKYIYAINYIKNTLCKFHTEIYIEHLECINGLYERDSSKKFGENEFISKFNSTINSITKDGYNTSYAIPSSNFDLLDGAHRTAIAIATNSPIYTVELDYKAHVYDYKFFNNSGLSKNFITNAIQEYIKIKNKTHFIMLWGNSQENTADVEKLIGNYADIVYRGQENLTKLGQLNIIRLAYRREPWLGTYSDSFVGAISKSKDCFSNSDNLIFYVIESLGDLVELKDKIRSIFKRGKHSIHINDTHEETIEIAQALLNENSLHHINNSNPKNFNTFEKLSTNYIKFLREKYPSEIDNFCIDGGAVLSAYGIRDCGDFDYLTTNKDYLNINSEEIECHNNKHEKYGMSILETIKDPRLHFYHQGVKFIRIEDLLTKKSQRGSASDFNDIESCKDLGKKSLESMNKNILFKKITSPRYIKSRLKSLFLRLIDIFK